MPSEFGATTQALSQAALQSMNQTYQVDAPSASYPHSYAPESSVHEDEPTEHTVQQPSPAPQTRPAQNTAGSLTATGTAKPPSWLMPHQTGDREAGKWQAEALQLSKEMRFALVLRTVHCSQSVHIAAAGVHLLAYPASKAACRVMIHVNVP